MRAYEFYWGTNNREGRRREPTITLKSINRAKKLRAWREAEKRWKIKNLYPAMYGNREDSDTEDRSDTLDVFDQRPGNKSSKVIRDMADEQIEQQQVSSDHIEKMAQSEMHRRRK